MKGELQDMTTDARNRKEGRQKEDRDQSDLGEQGVE